MTPHGPKALLHSALIAGMVALAPLSSQAAPVPAAPTQSIQINANLPALLQVAKDNKDELLRLAQTAAQYVRIDNLPADKIGFVRDAVAGDVLLTVNGIPIDLSLLSAKGSIDIAVAAEQGDISVSVASPYLPQLPLAAKRTVLAATTTPVEAAAMRTTERLAAAVTPAPSLWDQTTLDVLGKGWTNRQVVGSAALALGVAYGGSYVFYEASNRQAAADAEKKKQAMAAKRKAAAAAANVQPPKSPVQKSKEAVVTATSAAKKKKEKAAKPKTEAKLKTPQGPVQSKYVVPQDN